METEQGMSVFEAEQKIEELLTAHTEMRYTRKYVLDPAEAAVRLDRARQAVLEAMVRP